MTSDRDLLTTLQGLTSKRDIQLILIALKFIGDDHCSSPNQTIDRAGREYHDLAERIEMAIAELSDDTDNH